MANRNDSDEDEGGGGFALGDLIGLVRRRWLIIVASTALLAVLAALIAYSLPSRYEAAATVQIDPRKKTIVNLENVVSDLKADQSTVESEVEVLHSKAILLKVIEALELRTHPDFTKPTLMQRLLKRIGLAGDVTTPVERQPLSDSGVVMASKTLPGGGVPERDEIVSAFEKRLKVSRVRNTLLIEVKFSAGDPVLAARVANTLLEVYLKEQLDAKIRATGQATDLLEHKLDGLRQKVSEAERRVAAFKAQHNIFDAEGQLLSEKQLARLMEQTVIARNHTAEAKARFEQVHEMLRKGQHRNSIADVLQSPTIRLFKDQLVKATRREAELLTKYGPKHPEMARARAEVADVEAQLAVEVDKIVSNLETEFRVAAERERALAQSLGGLKDQQVLTKDAAVMLKELEREALSSKQVFEAFLMRYKQTAETADLQVADSRIVERADVPLSVASPKRMQLVILGTAAGLALGFGLALLLEFSSPGLRRPEDIEEALGIAHLASVPLLKRRSDGFDTPDTAIRAAVIVPDGVFAESLRTARYSIDIRRRDPNPRILLVTSALPNEGKTLLAANLAYQLATQGIRTLLIDADVRRSSLSQQLGVDRAPGLLEAIAHGHPFEGYLLRDSTTGLVVLPAGGGGQSAPSLSPVQALDAPGFGQRLARLKTYFDTIIVDAAPLLPVVDSRILADHADQIVLVTTWGKTPRQLLRRAIHLLGANNGKLTGAIINQVDVIEHAKSFGYEKAKNKDRSPAAPPKRAA